MTRLEGKAREAIGQTPTDVASFRTELKKAIKYDSSKVIEGKILALRAERTNLTKFSERAEELCDQYRRSLVDEGYTTDKAKELCIEKTVELCISQSHHDRLKTILTIKTFKEPKEVIAMMITQINKLRLEKLTSNNSKNNHQSRNSNGNKNHFKNGSSRSNQSHSGNSSQNRGYIKQNNQSNNGNNGGNRSNFNNGNRSNNQNNYSQGQSRTFTSNNYRRSNDNQTVRLISGNTIHPGNGGEMNDQ